MSKKRRDELTEEELEETEAEDLPGREVTSMLPFDLTMPPIVPTGDELGQDR